MALKLEEKWFHDNLNSDMEEVTRQKLCSLHEQILFLVIDIIFLEFLKLLPCQIYRSYIKNPFNQMTLNLKNLVSEWFWLWNGGGSPGKKFLFLENRSEILTWKQKFLLSVTLSIS